jgi:4,5-dihydroxyphthalate decarboxylase
MLPWAMAHFEEAEGEMGADFWPNGFEKNRKVLNTFLRYSYEQGLSKRQLDAEEIFAPETLDAFVI